MYMKLNDEILLDIVLVRLMGSASDVLAPFLAIDRPEPRRRPIIILRSQHYHDDVSIVPCRDNACIVQVHISYNPMEKHAFFIYRNGKYRYLVLDLDF